MPFTVGFNNVQGFGLSKQIQIEQVLNENRFDIVAIAESKRDQDHPVSHLHSEYKWIGKNRVHKQGGGIGFLYNSNTVSINNDDLLNSKCDSLERLWIDVNIGNMSVALGVVYFPVDNKADERENAEILHNELLQDIATLETSHNQVLLVGDFNGRISCFKDPGKLSSNGLLIENLSNVTDYNYVAKYGQKVHRKDNMV